MVFYSKFATAKTVDVVMRFKVLFIIPVMYFPLFFAATGSYAQPSASCYWELANPDPIENAAGI